MPPVHLLVDIIEEDFRRETTPHVFGPARRTVLSTRSARLFHATPYVHAHREGREREGRRDDRILFAAIVRPDRIEPWMELLREHEAPVAGIHSLPVTSAGLLPLLGVEKARVLVVTESGERDLRQTVFEGGRLVLSRLAPLPPGAVADRAVGIVREVERIVEHVGRSGRSTEGLEIRLVAGAPVLEAIRALGAPGEMVRGLVDRERVEGRLGRGFRAGKSGPGDASEGGCDHVLAQLALRRRSNHYAPASDLATHRTRQLGRALAAGGLAMLVAGAAWGASAWHRSRDLAAIAADLAREAQRHEARHEAERLPDPPVAPGDLRAAVEKADLLHVGRVRALPILRAVSEALSGFPDLRLETLEWFEASDRDGWTLPSGEDGTRERLRVVHLRGRFEPFDGHYRAAVDEVFRFADGLESQPRLSGVEVLEMPLAPPGGGLGTGRNAGFELRMMADAGPS